MGMMIDWGLIVYPGCINKSDLCQCDRCNITGDREKSCHCTPIFEFLVKTQ